MKNMNNIKTEKIISKNYFIVKTVYNNKVYYHTKFYVA